MLPKSSSFSALLVIVFSCSFSLLRFSESVVPQDEIDALQEISKTMGANYWKFNGDSCEIESVGVTEEPPKGAESSIGCECNNTVCHVTEMC